MTGEPPPPMPSRVSAWSVYHVFTLADGEQLFIGAVSDRKFETPCRVLDASDLANDPGLATNAERAAVRPELLRRLGEILQHPGWRICCRSSSPPAFRTRPSRALNSSSTTRI